MKFNPKQPSCKKYAAFVLKNDAKSKVAACGRLIAKIFDNNNSGNLVLNPSEGNTNSPELLSLKFLPLAYNQSHFMGTTLDFTSLQPSWKPHTFFSCWAVLD